VWKINLNQIYWGEEGEGMKRMGKKKHNEEYHDLYCSQNIYRVIRTRRITWAGRLASMGETRNTGRDLVGKPEGNRLLGRPRLDGIIYCGKRLQFCHGYSKVSYFSSPIPSVNYV